VLDRKRESISVCREGREIGTNGKGSKRKNYTTGSGVDAPRSLGFLRDG
jgi:hypothetical protein